MRFLVASCIWTRLPSLLVITFDVITFDLITVRGAVVFLLVVVPGFAFQLHELPASPRPSFRFKSRFEFRGKTCAAPVQRRSFDKPTRSITTALLR